MNAIADLSRNTRSLLCLLAAALIVTGSLLVWQNAADSKERGYTVTVEQLR